MKKRNIILEGRIKSGLQTLDISRFTVNQRGILLSSVEKLYHATEDEDYCQWVVKVLKQLVTKEGDIQNADHDLSDYLFGNALYFAVEQENCKMAVQKLAENLTKQERFDATETCEGTFSRKLGDTYKSQVFYMNYETKFGGKEHYNDIIAQYNSIRDKAFENVNKALGTEEADLEMAEYACAAIDTMEVMEQPLYEIYDRLKTLFKEAVHAMNAASLKGFQEKESTAALLYSYAVLKGCRMKALQTEKYEKAALEILARAEERAEQRAVPDGTLIMAYAESLRNREYQDYGRTKGGVLWS